MPSFHTSCGIRDLPTTTSTQRFDETTTHTSLTALVDGYLGEGKSYVLIVLVIHSVTCVRRQSIHVPQHLIGAAKCF